jgi:hypothetical protein
MSFDFQIAFPCPHLIQEERVPLDSDRRGMLISQPIASSGTVRVLVDDTFVVPSNGLSTNAVLQSSKSGAYRIPKNETTLKVSSLTETSTIELSTSRSISTDSLVKILNAKFTTIEAVNFNGHLMLKEGMSFGKQSRLFVEGSARDTLGFGFVSSARGRQLYPAWRLEKVEGTINERYPRFVSPLKNNPIIKVTYTTPAERCLRCGGSFVENDFRIDSNGDLRTISNHDLLYQICMKAILTEKGSNPFYKYYGTPLMESIGSKALMGIGNFLRFEVDRTLKLVQKAQTAQARYQTISFEERLLNVLNIAVIQHESDPTAFLIDVTVQSASQKPISLSIVYTAPSAVALAGSNGLSLGVK